MFTSSHCYLLITIPGLPVIQHLTYNFHSHRKLRTYLKECTLMCSSWVCCVQQCSGTINQFTVSCFFQVCNCFCKPQKDSLGLLLFHVGVPVLRALLQIMIWTWMKVSETYWRSNQSSSIKHFKLQDLEVESMTEIFVMNLLEDYMVIIP